MDEATRMQERPTGELAAARAQIAELEASEAERQRAVEEAQHRATQAALLYEVSQRLSGELELETLLPEIVTAICDAFDYYGVMLMLVDDEKQCLNMQAIAGGYIGTFSQDLELAVGEGMIGQAAASGETQISGNVSQDPHFVRAAEEETRSELSVPIKSGQQVIGVLDLQSDELDAFDKTDIVAMETLSTQIATAIENARLFKEASSRARRLAIVNRVAKAAGATLHLDRLMELVYEEIAPIFQPDAFFIALYDQEANELDFRFHVDEGVQQPPERRPLSGFSALVVSEAKPLIIRDFEREPEYHSMVALMGTGKPPASWLGAPLIVGEEVVGVINVQSYQPYAYDEEDEQLLFTIADQVAVALENARLFQERGRRAREMEVINEVGQTITSVLDLDAVLHQIVDAIKARFGHYFVSITMVEDERLVFRCGSTIGDSEARLQPGQLSVELGHESSLVAETARTGKPVLAGDTHNDPRYLPMEELPDTRCELTLPIKAQGCVIGVLDVQSDRPFAYDQADVDLLQALANEAGIAIENARLFEETRVRAEELAVLNELSQALTARLNVEQVLEEAHRGVSRLLDAANFYIGLYDPERHEIEIAFDVAEAEVQQSQGLTLSADTGICGYMIRNQTPVLIRENLADWYEKAGVEQVGPSGALSWLGAPLVIGDRVLGAMAVQSYTTPRLYDEHDQELLTAIASQTAIALQNASLFEETRLRAEELAALNELSQALTAHLSVGEVLEEAYRQTSRLVVTTNFYIALYDPDKDEVTFALDVTEGDVRWDYVTRQAGQGLTEYIIHNRAPLLIPENLPGRMEQLGIEMIGRVALSWLGVPLIVGDQVLGVMAAQSYSSPRLYDEHDRDLLLAIASQAAIALQNARLFEETRHRAQEMEVINEVGRAITSVLDPDTVLRQIVDATKARFGHYFVGILLVEGDRLIFRDGSVIGDSGVRLERGALDFDLEGPGLTVEAVRTGQPILTHDVVKDSRYVSLPETETVRSELAVPIEVKERVIGVLDVQSNQPYIFEQTDVALLRSLASQAGVALENAQLFEETQRRVREIQLLHDVGMAAASGVRLEKTLQAVVEAVAAEFEDSHVGVALVDPENELLRVKAATGYARDAVKELCVPLGEGIIGWVTQHGEPALVPDVRSDPRYYDAASDTRAELCVPLLTGSQTIGVLNVESPRPYAFTDDDQRLLSTLASNLAVLVERAQLFNNMEQMVADRTRELEESLGERERLQQEVIEAQRQAIRELSTPVIPVMDAPGGAGSIIVMPLIGSIDSMRARDIMRTLLAGIREYRAKVLIIDITGVPIVDSGVANHLNKTIQAARLKGARTIVTGISDAVAETIVDLGIDWSEIETLTNLRTGLVVALNSLGIKLTQIRKSRA